MDIDFEEPDYSNSNEANVNVHDTPAQEQPQEDAKKAKKGGLFSKGESKGSKEKAKEKKDAKPAKNEKQSGGLFGKKKQAPIIIDEPEQPKQNQVEQNTQQRQNVRQGRRGDLVEIQNENFAYDDFNATVVEDKVISEMNEEDNKKEEHKKKIITINAKL